MDTKWLRNSFVYLIILVAIIALFFTVVQQGGTPDVKPIALNQLAQQIQDGQIKSLEVTDERVLAQGNDQQRYSTRVGRDTNVLDVMRNFGVTPEQLAAGHLHGQGAGADQQLAGHPGQSAAADLLRRHPAVHDAPGAGLE